MKAAETTVLRLLQGSKVFLIPNFQRRYAWRKDEWEDFWDDLIREYEFAHDGYSQEIQGHFLGSVVLHPAPGPASTLMRHLVVDGQQRLTTILVLLAALRDVRVAREPGWNPAAYDSKYLTNPYDEDYPDRLVPTEFDQISYIETIRNGTPTGGVGQAYTYFRSQIESSVDELEIDLARLGDTLLMHMLLVEITTSTGDSVNNIFNTLNSKGLPLGAADLIRNELLLNLGEVAANSAYANIWLPMERDLVSIDRRGNPNDSQLVTLFWAREVASNPTTTKKNLFQSFERRLRSRLDSVAISQREEIVMEYFRGIERDYRLFKIILDPLSAEEDEESVTGEVRRALVELKNWGSEPYVPTALWILRWCVNGVVTPSEAAAALKMILGYLVRRAVVGLATNNLNRMLSPIPSYLASRMPGVSLVEAIQDVLSRPRYQWPTDREIELSAPVQPIFFSVRRNQTRFILQAINEVLSEGEETRSWPVEIEHVMPSDLSPQWIDYLENNYVELDDAEAAANCLGNLTLWIPSEPFDNSSPFAARVALGESPLRIGREVAQHETWTPDDIHRRGSWMAKILVERFVGPSAMPSQWIGESVRSVKDDLISALQVLPDGDWTTESELTRYLGISAGPLRSVLRKLGPELARLVRTLEGDIPEWVDLDRRRAIRDQGREQGDAFGGSALTAEEISGLIVGDAAARTAWVLGEHGRK